MKFHFLNFDKQVNLNSKKNKKFENYESIVLLLEFLTTEPLKYLL